MLTADLDYHLPPDRIAAEAVEPRDSARLLVVRRKRGAIEHRHVRDLAALVGHGPEALLSPGDLLVFNHSKVLPARFRGHRSATGGQVEGLYLGPATGAAGDAHRHWRLLLESRGTLREGEAIDLGQGASLLLARRLPGGEWLAELGGPLDTHALLDRIGVMPLPPYILKARRQNHQPEVTPADALRYNTVYARDPGSAAAPTAGLHFTPELLESLRRQGVQTATLTLHVGLGTFAPVRTERVEDHPIHREWIDVPAATLAAIEAARRRGARVVPVGTTTVRALESVPRDWPMDSGLTLNTDLFITPTAAGGGSVFRFTDALMTNFHLPRSTLLALVAALPDVGIERLKQWYQVAVDERYRFYSYGDAMWLA